MKQGRLTDSGTSHVSFQIVRVDFDFPSPPLDGTCDERDLVFFYGLWGPPPFVIGGGERIRAMPVTKSFLPRLFGAPLVAATFHPRAMCDANAPLDGSVGAPLVTATFSPRAVRDANAPLLEENGQTALFGAAVCQLEQILTLVSVLPQNRRAGGCCVCIPIHYFHRCCTFVFVWHMFFVYAHSNTATSAAAAAVLPLPPENGRALTPKIRLDHDSPNQALRL